MLKDNSEALFCRGRHCYYLEKMKPILILFTLFVSISSSFAGFSVRDIHEVRAYVYDYTQEKDNKTLLKNGKLHKGVINAGGAKLSEAQVKRLLGALNSKEEDQFGALCYMPHHGFVFYNKKGKALGHIELCFQCGNVDSSPKKLAARSWDWLEIGKLLEELKIPILKMDAGYSKLYAKKRIGKNKKGR